MPRRGIFTVRPTRHHTQNVTHTVDYGAVNAVSLIGQVVTKPELRTNRGGIAECRMKLAVPLRSRSGQREPGVAYVDVSTFGLEAQDHAEQLSMGSRIGLAGRLDADGRILIDQLDLL